MFDCSDVIGERDAWALDDPRLDERYLRCIPGRGDTGSVLVVGVVHDHPASVFRVARLVELTAPDVLAVELPPLAVDLFRMYADDVYTPPRLGGEMSMAIQAAGDAETVGIDAPNRRYLRLLVDALQTDGVATDVARTVLKDLASGFGHALACRLGALVGALVPLRLRLYSHIEYDCSSLDGPSIQADHEARHLSQRRAFLRAIDVPETTQLIDRTREAAMADRIGELRRDGDVVAVVGMEHLDALDVRLRAD